MDSKGAARCLELLHKLLGADGSGSLTDVAGVAREVEAMVRDAEAGR